MGPECFLPKGGDLAGCATFRPATSAVVLRYLLYLPENRSPGEGCSAGTSHNPLYCTHSNRDGFRALNGGLQMSELSRALRR